MSIDEAKLLIYMTEMFKRHGEDFDQIKSKFDTVYKDSPALRDRLPTYGHFYYFICAPGQAGVREELQIVGVTSLIDAMMGDMNFKDPFSYFESEFPGKNAIEDFQGFKESYLQKYGAGKKMVEYFKKYVPESESQVLLEKIRVWDKEAKKMVPMDVTQLAKFLYQMRSDFVHAADMQSLCSGGNFAAVVSVGKKVFDVRFAMEDLLGVFEKSFVAYWKDKYAKTK